MTTSHGYTWRDETGRTKSSPTYRAWANMRQRCTNPNNPKWEYYGGRGITVCARWADSFEAFLADMGVRPEGMSLDRIDTNGNYGPDNCRWTTWSEQVKNRRVSEASVANLAREVRAKTFKLTERDVEWIRVNSGVITQKAMAEQLGVSKATISDIVRRKRWRACDDREQGVVLHS